MTGVPSGIFLPLLLARLRAFQTRSEGALALFALFLFLGLVLMGGVGIDLMRYEQERVRLQGATDRAVLAATSLRQTQDMETVIRDYLARENLEHLIDSIETDQGVNFREARVTARGTVPTLLMHMVGIRELGMQVVSAAEERVPNLEISLVLDLSGSMNSFGRLQNLQTAAEEFINTVFGTSDEGSISMSLVPYTGQVNAGAALLDHFDVAHRQPFSHCVDFDSHHYNTTALPPDIRLQGAGHGNLYLYPQYGYYQQNNPLGDSWGDPTIYNCPTAPGNSGVVVRALGTEAAELIGRVNAMQARGATSIDIGMRWGVALLDPSLRPVVSGMIGAGHVDAGMEGRPVAFDDPETMKIVVLMTDGQNFEERRLRPEFKSGLSPVWINTAQGNSLTTYSLHEPSDNRYWHRNDGQWHDFPWGATGQNCTNTCAAYNTRGNCTRWEQRCASFDNNTARQLSWPELFQRSYPYWAARHIWAEAQLPGGTNNQRNTRAQQISQSWLTASNVSVTAKDQRLQQICNAAREAGITVFSVAFEADTGGINGLRQCATTPSHFFDVEGVEISEAFRAIASHIRQLRLVE
ncbi:pilus assembly protein TadG-related protein [Pararhodobacter sp.]|uniref:pilus assembly protein TadG-related protein n=1 Tax=Pararhodobacter sp. TaxID=2127056 RepID=UPI002FDE8F23